MAIDHRALFERYARALNMGDFSIMDEMLTDDYIEEYPQSGEIIRGRHNLRQIVEHYPGLEPGQMDLDGAELLANDKGWLMTPAFTLVRAEGSGETGTATFRTRYPDGSLWWVIIVYRLRGDRIAHSRAFFAPTFDPPEWRSAWVELGPTDSPV